MTSWEDRRDGFLALVRKRPAVMGILNVTPDSFSDGGQFDSHSAAVEQAQRMVAEGSDILDIGGESTRPGSKFVPEGEEVSRVMPIMRNLAGRLSIPISIDTYKAAVARQAVEAGAVVINDVWGLQRDEAMAETVAETGAAVVIMHNREAADPDRDVMDDMRHFLDHSLELAVKAGVPQGRIMVDPGIGFGKTADQSLTCLNRLDELADWYGLPVLLGLSRKRFIGHVLNVEVDERLVGTLAANMLGLSRGARVIRVHDVAEHAQAVKMFTATEDAS